MKKNSKKLSKIVTPLALASGCLATMPATSCGSSMYSMPKHIAPYLHEITYTDYREDTELETIKEAEAFGCSSVRNGNFYGRNFDYVFNDTPEFIVRVKANKEKNRHESIAVSTHFGLRENKLLKGKYDKQLELIPNLTMDGINDAGVICSSNVVSMEPNKVGETIYDPQTRPDLPESEKLHVLFIPRFILDNAKSAKDGVELLKTKNIWGNLNDKMNIHCMIADKNETYIVEFFHKDSAQPHFDVVARPISQPQSATDDKPIMTNFYRNVADEFTNDEKFGNERFAILDENYDEGATFAGMENLMKRVQFSKAYEFMHNPVAINDTAAGGDLNSEWYSEKVKQSILDTPRTKDEWEEFSHQLDDMKTDYWNHRKLDLRNPPNSGFWITTHNSTYDIEKKRLQIIVQEKYTEAFDYYL